MSDTIIVYPFPSIGHLISTVELAKTFLLRRKLSTIHVLIATGILESPSTTEYLRRISLTHPSITFHRLPFLHAEEKSQIKNPIAAAFDSLRRNDNVRATLVQISHTFTIHALIIDFFCSSAFPIAQSLGIPVYYFFTSGLAALAAYLHFPTIDKKVNRSFNEMFHNQFQIPGLPSIPARHMPQPVLDRNQPAYYNILDFSNCLAKSSGIIVNTFNELEPIPLKAITDGLCIPDSTTPPIYNIGPLIAEAESKSGEYCLQWLDSQPDCSVVFLCFGSRGTFSVDQIKEIAKGLENSGERFLWVLKRPPFNESRETDDLVEFDVKDVLPDGFLDRTEGKGLVVGSWAPQAAVLEHRSIGGFVTHCGWNSVLEAVTAGVPMVAWPLYAEQHVNKLVLVKDMMMAIGVEQREIDGFVSGDDVAMRVRELMVSDKGRDLRERSSEMKRKALEAWGEKGSSTDAIDRLVKVWLGK